MTYVATFDTDGVATVPPSVIPDALRRGWADFMARPTTAIFLIVVYPFIGLLLYRFASDQSLLPLLFPIASGFALVGPLTAAGLYSISRSRERNDRSELDGVTAYNVLGRDRLIPLLKVGLVLLVLYAIWIGAARMIYLATFGDVRHESVGALLEAVLTTAAGWALIIVGFGVGFLFALAALAIGALSLPAIVDRGVSASEAMTLSVRAFVANPRTMLLWGLVVATAIFVGSLPLFLGLMIVLPVFGHATWHFYRQFVPRMD